MNLVFTIFVTGYGNCYNKEGGAFITYEIA